MDVNCFLPLATKYGVYLNEWQSKSAGYSSLTKRSFYPIFWNAWRDSFTESNIQGGWRKTGIWPFLPPIVLDAIKSRPKIPSKEQDDCEKPPLTPMTSKSIRRAQRVYKANPTQANLNVILKSQSKLAVQHELDNHSYKALIETLKEEKQQRKRGKRLNLVGEEETSAQLFDADRVRTALAYAANKEELAEAKKEEKATRKSTNKERKQRKQQEVEDRKL